MEPAAANLLERMYVSEKVIQQIGDTYPGITLAQLQEQFREAERNVEYRDTVHNPVGFTLSRLLRGDPLLPLPQQDPLAPAKWVLNRLVALAQDELPPNYILEMNVKSVASDVERTFTVSAILDLDPRRLPKTVGKH